MATTAERLDSGAQAVDIDNRIATVTIRWPVLGLRAQQKGREAQRLTRMVRK